MAEIQVYPDAAGLARAAAERFVTLAAEAIAERGRFLVALAGGSTPRLTYKLLASGDFTARIDWPRVHVFWGDERCVPPDHPESNYRMARETLLDGIAIPPQNVHRIRGELPPERAAEAYQGELERFLGPDGRFDLILLGMGTDGHTASLFPGTPALEDRGSLAVAAYIERLPAWRVTLTLRVINASRHVVFLVMGAAKASALRRVQTGEPLPAGLVQPADGHLIWLVDRDAAGETQK
jgi:6-phosphogluconolactonase